MDRVDLVLSILDPGEGCPSRWWLEPLAPAGGHGMLPLKALPLTLSTWSWCPGPFLSIPCCPRPSGLCISTPQGHVCSPSTMVATLLQWFNEAQFFVCEVLPKRETLETELSSPVLAPKSEFNSFLHLIVSSVVPFMLPLVSKYVLPVGYWTAWFPGFSSFFKDNIWGDQYISCF